MHFQQTDVYFLTFLRVYAQKSITLVSQ